MSKEILIEGSKHKDHFKIFDYNCYLVLQICADLIECEEHIGVSEETTEKHWDKRVGLYKNLIESKELNFNEPIESRIQPNIRVGNKSVNMFKVDYLIIIYHRIKDALLESEDKVAKEIENLKKNKSSEYLKILERVLTFYIFNRHTKAA
jgi:hypothetical protein